MTKMFKRNTLCRLAAFQGPTDMQVWRVTISIVLFLQICTHNTSGAQAQEICGGVRNKFVCDHQNPGAFHICLGNNQYDMVCPGTLHFNEKTQNCDWPDSVNCVQNNVSSKESVSTTSPGQPQENGDTLSLHYTPRIPDATRSLLANKSNAGNNDYNIRGTDAPALETRSPQIKNLRNKATMIKDGDKTTEELMPEGNKINDEVRALNESSPNVPGYLDTFRSDRRSSRYEPYMPSYHRWLLPQANPYIQAKYMQHITPMLIPYRKKAVNDGRSKAINRLVKTNLSKLSTVSPRVRESHRKTTSKFNMGNSKVSKWYQSKALKGASAVDHNRRFSIRKQKNIPLDNNISPYQSIWKLNEISRSYKERLKTKVNNENTYKTSPSWYAPTSDRSSLITTKSDRVYRNHSPPPQFSTTDLDGSTRFPHVESSKVKRFKPRLTKQTDSSPKGVAQVNALHSSSKSQNLQDKQNSQMNTETVLQHNGWNSKVIKSIKYATQGSRDMLPSAQSSKVTSATRRRGISSHVRTPWWSTARSTSHSSTSTSHTTESTPSSRKLDNKLDKLAGGDKKNDPSVQPNFKMSKTTKGTKRPNRRKYKPRNYVPKPSYNTRSTLNIRQSSLTGLPTSNRQFSDSVIKIVPLHNSINSPASADRKPPSQKYNSKRSDDINKDSLKSYDNQPNTIKAEYTADKTKIEENSKENHISAYKSAGEKLDVKIGKCSSLWCKLPACRCIGSDIPGDLDINDVPQMVMLTFDDSVNGQNINFYRDLYNGTFRNPNSCPIKSTFFVSGDNSNYDLVKKLHKQGHEIASHTLSHRSPTTWWADAGLQNWEHEVVGMRDRLNEKAGVPVKKVNGMRAPFLQLGGDGQYAMLKENKFRYDSSMVTGYLYANNQPPIWPFTLDTPPDSTTCNIPPCPTGSYPGLWEVPLVRWYGSNKIACAMPDACTADSGIRGSHEFIEENFNRHYTTNKAPFGIFIHAAWFSRTDGSFEGLKRFLASLADKEDVWVVTISQALDWVQRPVRLTTLQAIDSWAC